MGPGAVRTHTINSANTSNTHTPPGAAVNVVLNDNLPPNTTYVSCGYNTPTSGTCAQAAGVVTWNVAGIIAAGAGGVRWGMPRPLLGMGPRRAGPQDAAERPDRDVSQDRRVVRAQFLPR